LEIIVDSLAGFKNNVENICTLLVTKLTLLHVTNGVIAEMCTAMRLLLVNLWFLAHFVLHIIVISTFIIIVLFTD